VSSLDNIEAVPVNKYSYSRFRLLLTNPLMFKIKYINGDIIDVASSASFILGSAIHEGVKTFLGGNDERAVSNDYNDALKEALLSVADYLKSVPDSFIKYTSTIPDRQKLEEIALKGAKEYISTLKDIIENNEIVMVEQELEETITAKIGRKVVKLPVPIVAVPDLVVKDKKGRIVIYDHKVVYRHSDADKVDGNKILQAMFYYFAIKEHLQQDPYAIVFREYKYTKSKDGIAVREYPIIYKNNKLMFDIFYRLYADITLFLSGKATFLPNYSDIFDGEISLLAYAQRLDDDEFKQAYMDEFNESDLSELLHKKLINKNKLDKMKNAIDKYYKETLNLNYESMKTTEEKIKVKLLELGMPLAYVDKVEGFAVDLYRFDPTGTGIKMGQILKTVKDIEQATGKSGIRILAPIPDSHLVGFEVPRDERVFPEFPKDIELDGVKIAVGVDNFGDKFIMDIADAPHVLVAGSTGSGKSVFLRSVITQLIGREGVDIYLFDPKMVELAEFQSDVRVYNSNPEQIKAYLDYLVNKMTERYVIMKEKNAKDVDEYNKKNPGNKMSRIVVVLDEFADLRASLDNPKKDLDLFVQRLGQLARAAGIHLVFATQRPSVDVISGVIKANFPTKIAFKTAKAVDSKIILDETGAEALLGKGDMLVYYNGTIKRLQGFKI